MGKLSYACMLDTKRLRAEREKRDLSMSGAAKLSKMATQQYERIENGDGLSLTLRTLNRIATGLKVPAKDLLR